MRGGVVILLSHKSLSLQIYGITISLVSMTDTADVKADLYRVLAHPMRLRVLELLQTQERSARDLQTLLELDSGAASQHLSALRRQGLVESRREGTTAIYTLADPRVGQLLDLGREIISTRLTAQHAVLEELAAERDVES